MTSKLSSLSRLSRDDLAGAPEWVDTLLQSSNEFQEQATNRINQDLLVGTFDDVELVHAKEKKVRNPYGSDLQCVTAGKCVGLSVDSAGKPSGGVYTLSTPRIDWRRIQARPGEPEFIGVTAYYQPLSTSGYAGEQQRSFVNNSSALTLATGVAQNITSISLTPGVWDITGIVMWFATAGPVTGTAKSAAISTTSATIPATSTAGDQWVTDPYMPTTTTSTWEAIPQFRVTVTSTTTYYLVSQAAFTAGTIVTWGRISAVRALDYCTGLRGRVTLRFDRGN